MLVDRLDKKDVRDESITSNEASDGVYMREWRRDPYNLKL